MRVLLAWELGGGAGHLHRLATIAQRLLARACDVTIAIPSNVTTLTGLADDSWSLVAAPPSPRGQVCAVQGYPDVLWSLGGRDLSWVSIRVRYWLELLRGSWDLIVADFAPYAQVAATCLGIPTAAVGTGYSLPPIDSRLARMNVPGPAQCQSMLGHDRDVVSNLNRAVRRIARRYAEPLTDLRDLWRGVTRILMTYPELDHYQNRGVDRYWGSFSPCRSYVEVMPRDDSKVSALGYLQRDFAAWPELASALDEIGASATFYVPGGCPEHLRNHRRIEFLREPFDPASANRFDLFISHGGHGSVSMTLLAGCPQLVIPLHIEQLITGRNIEAIRAGTFARWTMPDGDFRRAIRHCTSRKRGSAARRFAGRQPPCERFADTAIDELTNIGRSLPANRPVGS